MSKKRRECRRSRKAIHTNTSSLFFKYQFLFATIFRRCLFSRLTCSEEYNLYVSLGGFNGTTMETASRIDTANLIASSGESSSMYGCGAEGNSRQILFPQSPTLGNVIYLTPSNQILLQYIFDRSSISVPIQEEIGMITESQTLVILSIHSLIYIEETDYLVTSCSSYIISNISCSSGVFSITVVQ